ncbi:hypothetical protein [Flavobacterium sp.]|uniref:hypothetical protein n=1 Tax=Flavobacterium sp. TaxID=239 RepID=UPI002CBE1373|nr:hypothetical protein [Flavobacterium sp.]HSD05704.1 hypothetical protein [Flavobacterium sp.]
MKKLSIFCLLLAFIVLGSCKKEQKEIETVKAEAQQPVSTACYKALYENDTIDLKINTLKNGKIAGDMVMKIENKPEKVGTIEGEFRGDTLFADYSFIQGTNKDRVFKNPMAFLKRNDSLVLGSGEIITYLGKSYFTKGKPLNFKTVKYKFSTIECVAK